MIPITAAQIIRFAKDRAMLEMELGHRMYSVFDGPPVIGELRRLVRVAIEQIAAQARRAPTPGMSWADRDRLDLERQMLDHYCAGESTLRVWRWDDGRGPNLDGLFSVCEAWNHWNASDCSDLIRLYATIIEDDLQILRGTGFIGPQVHAHQQSRRRGGPAVWNKRDARVRATLARGYGGPAGALAAAAGAAPLAHIWAARALSLALAASWGGEPVPGIDRYYLMAESTVRKIDTVFGLAAGADISGTTADSVFTLEHTDRFLEAVRGQHVMGPGMADLAHAHRFIEAHGDVVQLLAPATMVSSGHHTLLESALTLTLSGYMSYSIGFYTTLMPNALLASDPLAQKLWEVFVWAEHHPWNRHMLCYNDDAQGTLRGYLFGAGPGPGRFFELQAMKALGTTGLPFLHYFHSWPAFPRQLYVDTLKLAYGL